MVQCDICRNCTPTSHGWKLPLYWKWVWCPTHAGGELKCTCKVCRWHLWRDSHKLEPHDPHDNFHVTEFFDAVDKKLQATLQPTTQSQRGCKRPSPSNSSDEDVDVDVG